MSIRLSSAILMLGCSITVLVGCSDDDPAAPPATGTITIDMQPNLTGGGWELILPGGGTATGAGDTTMADMKTGTYTLTWQPVAEYTTPEIFTGKLAADVTLILTGVYTWIDPNAAVIVIDVEPDAVDASWRLVREGQTGGIIGRGDGVEDYQMPGNYRVEWGAVVGYVTPDTLTMAVVSPETTTFTGLYAADPAQYPTPSIGWNYDNPLPQGFSQVIRGGAVDAEDGPLLPTSFVWTSSLDGQFAGGTDTINTGVLSVGVHEIELSVTDSDGLTATATDTVRIVTPPAGQPTVTIDRPAWGAYDVPQGADPTQTFGWDGTDAASGSGHPAFVRLIYLRAELTGGGYATTRAAVESEMARFTDASLMEWSPWLPWSEIADDRRVTFPNQPSHDGGSALIHYLFAVQAWSETGAVSTTFTYADNVAHFYIVPPK
ncbi:MAG: hypothetical protein GY838_15125 [bacterium]|nr:hypothetical protein [bacterium]